MAGKLIEAEPYELEFDLKSALEMIEAKGGIFGWVSDSGRALAAIGA